MYDIRDYFTIDEFIIKLQNYKKEFGGDCIVSTPKREPVTLYADMKLGNICVRVIKPWKE